jgi:hypothetical protein
MTQALTFVSERESRVSIEYSRSLRAIRKQTGSLTFVNLFKGEKEKGANANCEDFEALKRVEHVTSLRGFSPSLWSYV